MKKSRHRHLSYFIIIIGSFNRSRFVHEYTEYMHRHHELRTGLICHVVNEFALSAHAFVFAVTRRSQFPIPNRVAYARAHPNKKCEAREEKKTKVNCIHINNQHNVYTSMIAFAAACV